MTLSYIVTNRNFILTRVIISWKIEGYLVMSDGRK
jgi:hypothetical protein